MRILVTGAGGYIGRRLIPRLKDEGHEVIELHRAHHSDESKWYWVGAAKINRFVTDLAECPASELQEELPTGIDTVIHLAGRVDINLQPNPHGAHLPPVPGPCDIGALYRDNVLATANVLQYCLQAGVKHLIFASTQAVYGMEEEECQECGNPAQTPLEYYAASKLAAERLLEIGRKQGLAVTILRLPGVFGGDRKEGAVYNMCRDAVTKKRICVTLQYPIPMNVMHIEDVAGALVAAIGWRPPHDVWANDVILDISGEREECGLDLLAKEIALLAPECSHVLFKTAGHPVMNIGGERAQQVLNWHPKPRKERLAQVLEEIRCAHQDS